MSLCISEFFLFSGAKDSEVQAIFADTVTRLVTTQSVGVGVNRQLLHPLDKEYTLSLVTDRGNSFMIHVLSWSFSSMTYNKSNWIDPLKFGFLQNPRILAKNHGV